MFISVSTNEARPLSWGRWLRVLRNRAGSVRDSASQSSDRKFGRILIVGGGFAGVSAALHLEKIFVREQGIDITLVSDNNFLLFTPMLPEVSSGSIEPKHIVGPVRAFFRKVNFRNLTVRSIDLEKRVLVGSHCPACEVVTLRFEWLILALGSVTNFYGLPGVADNSLAMKTLDDAMAIQSRIIDMFEHAELQSEPLMRKLMLTFVVAGAGFAGVETAAGLQDFAHRARRYYPSIRPEEVRVALVDPGSRIMPEISETLASYALRKLRKRGVEVLLNRRIKSASVESVDLSTGEKLQTKTLIWTAGVAPNPLLTTLPCARNRRGQIVANEYLEVPGQVHVWAVGDCAEVPNARTGHSCPPTAQYAVRQGKIVARGVAAFIQGRNKRRFLYKPLGALAALGRRSAVAEIFGLKFSGFFAWWLWRTVYLLKLPGLDRKLRVAMDWTLDLWFPPDIALLRGFAHRASSDLAKQADSATRAPTP